MGKTFEQRLEYRSWEMVVTSHSTVLNGFIDQVRRYVERERKLAEQEEIGEEYVSESCEVGSLPPCDTD